jgi:predicted nucleic acid-binding protein
MPQGRSGTVVLVVDASVLAVALVDDESDGTTARDRLRGEEIAAPELVDLEVASVLRGLIAGGQLSDRRAVLALTDLTELPIRRAPHVPLLARCWELRANLTIYDAAYVALAEAMHVPLVTADRRIAAAPGVACPVEVLR